MLNTTNHSRDSAGLTYVYPVISRRSGGLSIGVNLNPNNACNWHCVYCQVEGLRRGNAPVIDMAKLEDELRGFLEQVLHGDFFQRHELPEQARVIRDIAISGNGEPTTSPQFVETVELIDRVGSHYGLLREKKPPMANGQEQVAVGDGLGNPAACQLVLITNGSQTRRDRVRRGLAHWGRLGGEVWFKLDSATQAGCERINGVSQNPASTLANLESAAGLATTWLQTCLFAWDGMPPPLDERKAYLEFLAQVKGRAIPLRGVQLYGLARASQQAEACRLGVLEKSWLETFADELRCVGWEVRLSL